MTKIEWTEVTWNPIVGCSLASPGCTNCYAMRFAGTRLGHVPKYDGLTQPSKAGPVWTGKLAFDEKALLAPLGWKKPRMVFVNSMGDLFHESVPYEWIDRVFAVMALCPQHTFQVLTKRSARMRKYLAAPFDRTLVMIAAANITQKTQIILEFPVFPLPNVWLGVSVEDQQRADERIPDLLATPAAVRWISAEPLLGPVDLKSCWLRRMTLCGECPSSDEGTPIDCPCADERLNWVVVGGESGSEGRPMHPDWARSLRDQCAAADVPFFFKQWGEYHPADQCKNAEQIAAMGAIGTALRARAAHSFEDQWTWKIGKKRAGRLLDGIEHNGMPV